MIRLKEYIIKYRTEDGDIFDIHVKEVSKEKAIIKFKSHPYDIRSTVISIREVTTREYVFN